jgi:hypothetical protein
MNTIHAYGQSITRTKMKELATHLQGLESAILITTKLLHVPLYVDVHS